MQCFPVREHFSFAITSLTINDPASGASNPSLLAFDLTRGGRRFEFSSHDSGGNYSGFAQDTVRWRRFIFLLGLRYDVYRFLVTGNQLQPRVGLSFHLRETTTVFRASYNRTYQTRPTKICCYRALPKPVCWHRPRYAVRSAAPLSSSIPSDRMFMKSECNKPSGGSV
jgi:TonB-dependent receptor-like protein